MASRQEQFRQAFDHERTAHSSPQGAPDSEEFPQLYLDQSLVVEQQHIYASCYPKTPSKQPFVSDVEPIQVGSLTQSVLEVIGEPPIPIHNLNVEKTLGDLTPDCHCEESNAHGPCPPCLEWTIPPTPLEEHLGLSPHTDRLRF